MKKNPFRILFYNLKYDKNKFPLKQVFDWINNVK